MGVDIGEIATTTLEARTKTLADNVTENNALLTKLSESGKVRPVDGGEVIWESLDYDENQTFAFYSGYEQLDIRPSQVIGSASFPWRQSNVNVIISGLEEGQNSGREKVIDLLDSRIENAMRTMKNKTCEALYGDGTAYDGKSIDGLAVAIPSSVATGTYGGIPRAAHEFWRPKHVSGGTAENVKSKMFELWAQLEHHAPNTCLLYTSPSPRDS